MKHHESHVLCILPHEVSTWFKHSSEPMPQKIRELIRDLERAGFVNRGGSDHRNFVHPKVPKPVTISGKPGDDAREYQERAVQRALEEASR